MKEKINTLMNGTIKGSFELTVNRGSTNDVFTASIIFEKYIIRTPKIQGSELISVAGKGSTVSEAMDNLKIELVGNL